MSSSSRHHHIAANAFYLEEGNIEGGSRLPHVPTTTESRSVGHSRVAPSSSHAALHDFSSVVGATSSPILDAHYDGPRHNRHQSRPHHRQCCLTIPLWLGCAILCTLLVGLVGFSPFLGGLSNGDVIVRQARNTYNTIYALSGQAMTSKYINEASTAVFLYVAAARQPQNMTAVNFSSPMWDREWQLFFTGVAAMHPERYFYYMDLVTGTFTGQYVQGSDNLRIVGNVNDVNFTGYSTSKAPPFRYTNPQPVSLKLPPIMMFNAFFATGTAYTVVEPVLAPDGELVYMLAAYVIRSTTDLTPVGALAEVIPITHMVNISLSSDTSVSRSSEFVVLDLQGALVACNHPGLEDIYLPVGTPGAICTTAEYNGRTISKCRHSLQTMSAIWPLVAVAHSAITNRIEGVVDDLYTSVSYVMFKFEGKDYLISASSAVLSGSVLTDPQWWSAAITPIDPVYGPYTESRKRTVIIVSCVCAGMAVLALVLTYALMLPLNRVMEQMIAALKLQTQRDRYAKSVAEHGDMDDHHSSALRLPCAHRQFHVSELRNIELAVVRLHGLLEDVAKMLPPAVILRIRTTLLQPSRNVSPDTIDGGMTTDGLISSEDQSDAESGNPAQHRQLKARQIAGHDVEQMLSWFEQNYHLDDGADVATPLDVKEGAFHVRSAHSAQHNIIDGPVEVVALETRAQRQIPGAAIEVELHAAPSLSSANGILMNPSVSLRPARRRGYFMAVSLTQLTCEPSHLADAIAPLLSLVWHHGGEVELIERGLILASFGCYDALDGAPDCAMTCGIAIADTQSFKVDRTNSSLLVPGRCFVTIDCGWFETSSFSCVLPSGSMMRRQVVSSVARDVVIKLLPLAEVLNEQLLISGDALRYVQPKTLVGRVPMIVDYLRVDARSWSKMSRRASLFVFTVPHLNSPESLSGSGGTLSIGGLRKNDARLVADGFRLMVTGRYTDAEAYFHNSIERAAACGRSTLRAVARMLAISSAIANVQRRAAGAQLSSYFRGECTLFEATMDETRGAQEARGGQRESSSSFMNMDELNETVNVRLDVSDTDAMGSSQRGTAQHSRSAKSWKRRKGKNTHRGYQH